MKRGWVAIGLLLLAILAMGLVATLRTPSHLWRVSGEFADCPVRPSCVSTRATDEVHRIEPLRYAGDSTFARDRLRRIIQSMPGARVEHETPEYLHAVFVTPRMRFRDDVEVLVETGGTIQLRSISRFGYRDRGVNRARIEEIRRRYLAGE